MDKTRIEALKEARDRVSEVLAYLTIDEQQEQATWKTKSLAQVVLSLGVLIDEEQDEDKLEPEPP